MKRGRYIILQQVTCNNWLVIYHYVKRQTTQYLTFSNRIALERAKLYHKPPESHITYDKVNPPINALFLLNALYNKRLILS